LGKWRFLTATERLRLGSFLGAPLESFSPGGLVTLNCMRGALPNRKLGRKLKGMMA